MKDQARRMTKAEAQAVAAWSARRQPTRSQAYHVRRRALVVILAMLALSLAGAAGGILTAPWGLLPVR